jgi:hypothetical protein
VEQKSVRDEDPEYVLPFRVCVRYFIVLIHRKKQTEVP